MKNTPLDFLRQKTLDGVWLNDNHNNYIFLELWDTYYKNEPFNKVKRKFHYYMIKLVKDGLCRKSIGYLSGRDFSNTGRKTIINYIPTIKEY